MQTPIRRFRKLFFIYAPNCAACDATKPTILEFAKRHKDVPVFRIDITETPWPEDMKWAPEVTPTFYLSEMGRAPRMVEGYATLEKLEEWVNRDIGE